MTVAMTRPLPVQSRNARGRFAAWWLAAVLTVAAGAVSGAVARAAEAAVGPAPVAGPPTPAASPAPTAAPVLFPGGTVAKLAGMELTRADLAEYSKTAKDTHLNDNEIATGSSDTLRPLVDQIAVSLFVANRYLRQKKEIENAPIDASILRAARHDEQAELSQRYARQEVLAKMPEPTEQEAKAFYEKNLDRFTVPLVFSMRQIFVSTYEKVLTTEKDTLEGLAKRIAGDENAVGLILVDNDAKSPRAPGWTADAPGATKPLEAGEHLLVPMSPEKKKEREARILKARKLLQGGEDFVKVAKEYSDAGTGELIEDLPMTGRPVLPQFLEAAKATAAGELSQVFETKHGYNLIRVEAKSENKPVPLEKVSSDIIALLRSDNQDRALAKATDELIAQPGVVIHYADLRNMAKTKDQNKQGDVTVVTVDDTSITLSEMGNSSLGTVTADTPDAEILRVLRGHPAIREALFARAALKLGLEKAKDVQLSLAAKAYRDLYKALEDGLKNRIVGQTVSDEEKRAFYDKNIKELSAPETCSFYMLPMRAADTTGTAIISPAAEKAIARARELVASVKTAEEFKKVAIENTEDENFKKAGCLVEKVPVTNLPPNLAQALSNAKVGSMTEPIYLKPGVIVAWLLDRTEGRTPTFDEAKDTLADTIHNKRLNEAYAQVRKEMVEQLGLVMQ